MLQSFYNVIEDQKYYYSDPIYRKFDQVRLNHRTCAPGSTRDVCFGSQVSPIISVPDASFSILGLGLQVQCKISVPDFRSQVPLLGTRVSPVIWVPGLGSRVPVFGSRASGPESHPQDGSRVSGLGSRVPPKVPGLGSHFWNMPKKSS